LITQNLNSINEYKIYISYAYGIGNTFPTKVINTPFIGEPNSVCTETYLLIGPFKNKTEAQNAISYMNTRFFRFLVLLLKSTQHGTSKVYTLVPLLDFKQEYIDQYLYEYFNLEQSEIEFIEALIKIG
jgi:site-specific DNA-methyltransferase (adenine-specific)